VLDRHDLTDEEWERLEPLLPDRTPCRGGRWADHRQMINGVLWRTRTGAPWRDLPPSYGNWKTVYSRHRRWSGDGTWAVILDGLRAGCDVGEGSEWIVGSDATVVRGHQHAAGARHAPPGDIPAEKLTPVLLDPARQAPPAPDPAGDTGGWVE
jgi:transposase